MQRGPVGCGPGFLPVNQKRFAHVGKRDFFEVVERLDRGVFAGPAALPCTEQRGQRSQVGMEIGRHPVRVVGRRSGPEWPEADAGCRSALCGVYVRGAYVFGTEAATDNKRRDEL